MKFVLMDGARELMASSVKTMIPDPVLLIHRGGCTCTGRDFVVEYASKSSVERFLEGWGFERIGEVEGIPIFMSARLRGYLEHIHAQVFIIDVDRSDFTKGSRLSLTFR
ncbi:MAG: hypothetical protein QXO94_00230 [Candidatus Bathyarchaeia archaeon]